MKIKYDSCTRFFEIETQTLQSFCQTCGKFIGSIVIVKGSECLNYIFAMHLCVDCFDELGLKRKEPQVAK